MDRLVTVDLADIHLSFHPSTSSSTTFTLTNLMHAIPVAIQVSTTRPHLFTLDPVAPSLLPPLSSATFTLTLAPLNHPPVTSPPDTLTVRSALFPVGNKDLPALRKLFSRPGGARVFTDATIPISIVGPHVIDALLLSSNHQTLESSFLISKAINFCTARDLSSLLRRSAAAGNPRLVAALVAAGADVDSRGSDNRSALSLAVSSGDIDAVRLLVNAGARIDAKLDLVFHEAAAGNRIDLITVLERSGRVCLDWAGLEDSGGRTPIHYAAANGHLDAVGTCLVNGNGDVDKADLMGWTPLHCAAYGGFLDVVELLINWSDFDPKIAVTQDGKKTPLDLAVEGGHEHLYDALGLGDRLLQAASAGDLFTIEEYISRGVRINQRDQNGWTALHRAAFGGWIDVVRVLIENGSRLEALDDVGFTPLRCAIEAGHIEVALLLVERGAKARLKGIKGADLFAMKLISPDDGGSALLSFPDDGGSALLSFGGENRVIET